MPKKGNYQHYLERKIDKELEKNILALIDQKLKSYNFESMLKHSSNRNFHNSFNQLTTSISREFGGSKQSPRNFTTNYDDISGNLTEELSSNLFKFF